MTGGPAWPYILDPGTGADGPVLLLLHGTGGDERDLVPLARQVAPAATLLSPRGPVLENGMPRFFRRTPEDPFRFPDLVPRTAELAAFVRGAMAANGLEGRPVVAVGYSNGANAAASLLLHHPDVLAGAALLRPLLPAPPPEGLDLSGVRVLVAGGRDDGIVPPAMTEALVSALRGAGATVEEHWAPAGHGLTAEDLTALSDWVSSAG